MDAEKISTAVLEIMLGEEIERLLSGVEIRVRKPKKLWRYPQSVHEGIPRPIAYSRPLTGTQGSPA